MFLARFTLQGRGAIRGNRNADLRRGNEDEAPEAEVFSVLFQTNPAGGFHGHHMDGVRHNGSPTG
jgi:hypothetical protein